ncbi:MAG: TetR family transcriptional regulator [Methylocella sp.]|jgi:AcrR family transcriptional regulator
MTRNFTQQTKFMKRMLVFNGRADSQNIQVEQEPKEKDIRKLIVAAAERLFRQIGYQKTTVIDIAHELHMSPTNIYRYFAAKSEITEAVCMGLLGKIEAEARKIAASRGTAMQRIRNLIGFVEATHLKQYMFDRKLHDLIDAAIIENWSIMHRHNERMAAILEQIIASGMASGEFQRGDATLASRLVNTACVRFSHPRLIEEFKQEPEPTSDQIIGFCLTAMTKQPD